MVNSEINNKRDIFEKEGRLFNHISAMYIKTKGFEQYWQNRRKNLVLNEMSCLVKNPKIRSLLDIGCAEGLFSEEANELGFGPVIGIDVSNTKLKRALKRAHISGVKIDYILGSADNLPFRDNVFDLILLSRVLELVSNEEQCLKEVYRVAKSYLILTVPSIHPNPILCLKTIVYPKNTIRYPWGAQARLYSLNGIIKKLYKDWYIIKSYGVAPISHSIIILNRKIWKKSRLLDDIFENRLLYKVFGHDIYILSLKLKK